MTDKKEIIIDGVDISKCKYYDEVFNYCNQPYLGEGGLLKNIKNPKRCDCSPNCYFKQLKRKEQKLSNICKTFDIEYVIDKETGSLIGRCNKLNKKQQECEKYKQAFDEIKEICNSVENIENINSLYDAKLSGMFLQANKILQKISEVENE